MKNKILQYLKLCVIVFGLTVFVFNCQQEDDLDKQNQTSSVTQKSTTKTVSGKDIPEVLSFIQSKSNSKMQFRLDDSNSPEGQFRNHEENLSLTTTLTEQIKQVTNSYGKSNYTFKLIEEETKEGVYFLNLVVKEYKDTFYLYIMKHLPEANWLKNYRNPSNLGSFTGTIYYYSEQGVYLAKAEMLDGASISVEKHPCPDEDQDDDTPNDDTPNDGSSGTSSGSGSNSNTGTSDGSTDGSSSSSNNNSGGTGGSNIDIIYNCCSCEGDLVGDDGHDHVECSIEIVVNLSVDSNGDTISEGKSFNDYLRHPCEDLPEECYEDNGDPCPYGCNVDENGCAANPNENDDIAIITDDLALSIINDCAGPLDFNQTNWLLDSENSETLMGLSSFINDNECSPEIQEFVEKALETSMDNGEVDFDDKIFYDESFDDNCKAKKVADKLKTLNNEVFTNIIETVFESSRESHLFFKVANIEDSEGNEISGFTTPTILSSGAKLFVIEIDPDFIENSSLLNIAQVIIHEVIHAEIFERLIQLGIIEINSSNDIDFISSEYDIYSNMEDLHDQSIVIYTETFFNNENWSHELFNVEFYRDMLRANLESFHELIDDSSFISNLSSLGWDLDSDSGIYSALSWNGLQFTSEFEDLESSDLIVEQILHTKTNSNSSCDD